MQFATSFVEYVVSGCTTLLWIIPLLQLCEIRLNIFAGGDKYLLILLPLFYVLGMLVDSFSSLLLSRLKPVVRRGEVTRRVQRVLRSEQPLEDESTTAALPYGSTAYVTYHSAELGRLVLAYSSRDRMARGAFLNSCIAAIMAFFLALSGTWGWNTVLGALVLVSGMFMMWWRFEYLSHRFKQDAVATIIRNRRRTAGRKVL